LVLNARGKIEILKKFCRVTIDVTPYTIQKRLSPIEC
jgi:hypothetical protein